MKSNPPLVNNTYFLKKFPGKGGWTYASIPEVLQDKSSPFGWVKVCGFIDGIEFKQFKLMPMGNGTLFFPVNAELRKKIKKRSWRCSAYYPLPRFFYTRNSSRTIGLLER